ncbi:hypothetical protein GCM10027187_29430 [Streptosporangium sandarakinum]
MSRLHGGEVESGQAVASWRDAPYFTAAERIALELAESVLTPNPSGERVPDELCARASEQYDGKALATLIMAIGQVCFLLPWPSSASRCRGCPRRSSGGRNAQTPRARTRRPVPHPARGRIRTGPSTRRSEALQRSLQSFPTRLQGAVRSI